MRKYEHLTRYKDSVTCVVIVRRTVKTNTQTFCMGYYSLCTSVIYTEACRPILSRWQISVSMSLALYFVALLRLVSVDMA